MFMSAVDTARRRNVGLYEIAWRHAFPRKYEMTARYRVNNRHIIFLA